MLVFRSVSELILQAGKVALLWVRTRNFIFDPSGMIGILKSLSQNSVVLLELPEFFQPFSNNKDASKIWRIGLTRVYSKKRFYSAESRTENRESRTEIENRESRIKNRPCQAGSDNFPLQKIPKLLPSCINVDRNGLILIHLGEFFFSGLKNPIECI